MNSALLLTAALFLSSTMMFAQQGNVHSPDLLTQQQVSEAFHTEADRTALDANRSYRMNAAMDPMKIASADDTVCYKIRSYVVARDSKHSDSVHPVGYSTCQPAGKYRLRTTQINTSSAH